MRTLVSAIFGLIAGLATTAPALAQAEQFIPLRVYRTGPYAVKGVPYANGVVDYYNLVNARDSGVNGVKLSFEECETGYATDKGVECYERLKTRGSTGAAFFNPLSTGITFALTELTWVDKIPLIMMGYGRADSKNGAVFKWNFPLLGTYWTAGDIASISLRKWAAKLTCKEKRLHSSTTTAPTGRNPNRPCKFSQKKCANHEGACLARVQQWDGKTWNVISDWYTADQAIIQPLVDRVSSEFAKENGIKPRDCGSAI